MVKKNIAIVGVGQIGSRHLQALNLLKHECNIFIVDPSSKSLQKAKKKYLDSSTNLSPEHQIEDLNSIHQLPNVLDVVIVATNSTHRAGIISTLVLNKIVKAFILEKVLFQSLLEYETIGRLLKKHAIPTWVNCWMRATSFYRDLKTKLVAGSAKKMIIKGRLWGVGCNSIHFIDLFAFLTDDANICFGNVQLDREIFDAKREGYKEFTGKISCFNSKGDSLKLICQGEENESISIHIKEGDAWHEIVGDNEITYRYFNGTKVEERKISIPYQSQTTNVLVNQIIADGNCKLTPLDESIKLHIPFIKILLKHLSVVYHEEITLCPIT